MLFLSHNEMKTNLGTWFKRHNIPFKTTGFPLKSGHDIAHLNLFDLAISAHADSLKPHVLLCQEY